MADIISPERRSALMSRIRGKDTKIELAVRRGLHALGFRYRLGGAGLPGRPDIVLPKYHAVVFVHGCFWHGHEGCPYFRLPKSRADFWEEKIFRNRSNDKKQFLALREKGWRVGTVWECSIRNSKNNELKDIIRNLAHWIKGAGGELEIRG